VRVSPRTAATLLVPACAAVLIACGSSGGTVDSVADRLEAVTAGYYDGLADGDAEAVRDALCRAERTGFEADDLSAAGTEPRTELIELREVHVEGDSAQALAVLTSADADDRRLTYPLQYRYEDGWKLC